MNEHPGLKIPVLLLGTYHMANPGKDAYNIEADDVLTERRQTEIQEVVDGLARFRSTKIALESAWQDPSTHDRYEDFLADRYSLGRNEGDQIGFRLGRMLGHKRVYSIDVSEVFGIPEVDELVNRVPEQMARWQEMDSFYRHYLQEFQHQMATSTLQQILYETNTPKALDLALQPYIRWIAPVAGTDRYPGAEMVANWYRRNLKSMPTSIELQRRGTAY